MGRHYCRHCNQFLSKTIFYQHKRLYCDRLSKKWSSTRVDLEAEHNSGNAFSLTDSENELDDQEYPFEVEEDFPSSMEIQCNDGKCDPTFHAKIFIFTRRA